MGFTHYDSDISAAKARKLGFTHYLLQQLRFTYYLLRQCDSSDSHTIFCNSLDSHYLLRQLGFTHYLLQQRDSSDSHTICCNIATAQHPSTLIETG